MAALKLFSWMGRPPREVEMQEIEGRRNRPQVSCYAAFPSKAAFMRALDIKLSIMPYVSVGESEREPPNEGFRTAVENPGQVIWMDDIRHPRKDAPYLVHPEPTRSI